MAKQIAMYQPTTTIQPAEKTSSKSFDEWSNSFEHLSKQINNMRVQDVDFNTIQEAKEAGASPDFQEHAPRTREDKIYERAALKSNEITLSNQVRTHALELRDELTKPGNLSPTSGVKFKAQMNEYLEGVVGNAPEGNKAYIQNMGQRYINSIGSTIDMRSNALAKSQLRFNLYSYINGQMQMAQRYAFDGTSKGVLNAAALYGQIADKINSAVMAGYMPGAQGASLLARSQQQLQVYSVLGKFRTDMQGGNAEQSLLQFMNNPPADMAPAQYKQALSMMQGMMQTQMESQKLNAQMIGQQTANVFNAVASGQMDPNSIEVSEAYQNASAMGKSSEGSFNSGLASATVKGALANSTKFISPVQAEQTANMLIQKLDPGSPNYQIQLNAINEAKVAAYRNWKKFASDPAAGVMDSPMVQQAIQTSQTEPSVPYKSGGITSDGQFLNANINKAIIAQEKMLGATENPPSKDIPQLSLLSKGTARNMASTLNAMPVEVQVQKLQQLQKEQPDYFPIILRDLKNGGYTLGNQQFFALSQLNPASQFDAINAQRMTQKDMDSLTKKQRSSIQTAVTGYLADYNASLNNYALPSSDLLQSTNDTLTRLAQWYVYSGKTSDPSAAAKMAYKAYIEPAWNFENLNGLSPIRFPKDLQAAQLKAAAKSTTDNYLSPNSVYIYQGRPIDNAENYYQGITANGRWVNLPDNSGLILTDETGSPVQIKINGKISYVGFKFDDLRNPNSKLNQRIGKYLMDHDINYNVRMKQG